MRARLLTITALAAVLTTSPARAEFPYPSCGGCPDPSDYEAYLFNPTTDPPTIPSEIAPLDFRVSSLVDPSLPNTPEELGGVSGMSVDLAWQISTGRPDVTIAILDSGVVYDSDLARKAALNQGELPLPESSAVYDANGDGVFNVTDYASDSRVGDEDSNGILDPRDLIMAFSDGTDDDLNGYTDDICGWDTHEHDNDPYDDVRYGHGTGEAKGAVGEVNNGGGFGIAPSSMFVPIKVSDSFIADSNDFAAAVAFAVDSGVTIVSEALGALNNSPFAGAAIEYAREHGVPVIASAADEQSYHHNYPAANEHVFWANSVRPEDGTLVQTRTNLLLNGCTNYGGKAQVAISSRSCSSEATERAAGMFALLYSAAQNEIDRGNIAPHPVTGTALSPDEALQLMSMTADDIDFSSAGYTLAFETDLLQLFPNLFSQRFPSTPGYDKYFGYGRANAATAIARVAPGTIPPEADIADPHWFDVVDPADTPLLDIRGTAAAHRNSNLATYTVEWACGVDPSQAEFSAPGHELVSLALGGTPIQDDLLAVLGTTGIEAECGFDTLALPRTNEDDFDESFSITIRLRVTDTLGNDAESRKNVFVHHDATLRAGFPIDFGTSLDPAPVLADLDGDGDDEIVLAAADGSIHAVESDGSELAGWPVQTNAIPLELGSDAYQLGALGGDFHNAVLGSPAVGDLDGDGSAPEVVTADLEGFVYVFNADGSPRAGFPVELYGVFSDPAIRDEANRLDKAVFAAPALADLDADGDLEILIAAGDRHLYVWNADGSEHAGFPVLIVDQERMQSVDPTTHKVVWKQIAGQNVGSRGTKLVAAPAVGDLDGDGDLEIVVGSNEEYVRGEEANFFISSVIITALEDSLDLPNGRVYALSHLGASDPDTAANPSGPFLEGWPVKIGMFLADLLPTVGHGVGSSPVLADVNDDGDDEVLVHGNNGPGYMLDGDGTSLLGTASNGKFRVLDAVGAPGANPGAGSTDYKLVIGVVGNGAAGDFTGDGVLDFSMPTNGVLQLLDAQGPAWQGPGDNQLTAWNLGTGNMLSDFPQKMEDLQFLTGPTVADFDGNGRVELFEGSGGYYLHAFSGVGGRPLGWPKFTGGWTTGAIALGDLDGDDSIDAVAGTREGRLYAWEGAGSPSRIQWATISRDVHHSGNVNSGVPAGEPPPDCTSVRRGVVTKGMAKFKAGAGNDSVKIKAIVNLMGPAIDPVSQIVRFSFGDENQAIYSAEVPAGSFAANAKATSFKFSDPTLAVANGLKNAKIKKKKGVWELQVQAKDVDATITGSQMSVFFQIGGQCVERLRTCTSLKSGTILKCS